MSDRRTKCLTVDELERVNANSASAADAVNLTLSKAAWVAVDGDKARRLESRMCARCFYLLRNSVAGRAFTDWACQLCGCIAQHSNTGVPRVCGDCSDAFRLCTHCGGDIEMKFRTKRFGRKARKAREHG